MSGFALGVVLVCQSFWVVSGVVVSFRESCVSLNLRVSCCYGAVVG